MKQISIVFTFFLVAAFYGCSTTNVNSNSNVLPTCTANPISLSEKQDKQCCLKDSLNIIIKQEDKICKVEEKNDSVVDVESSTTNISPSIKYAPQKGLKVDGKIENQSTKVDNSGIGCFGHNCEINNIYFESKTETKQKDCQQKKKQIFLLLVTYLCYLSLLSVVFVSFFAYHFYQKKKIEKNQGKKVPVANKKDSYEILSPYINKGILSEQTKKQLEFAVINERKQIKNIAITGPYGAGKSSIWASFCDEKEISENDQIQISFANFKSNSTSKKDSNVVESELERVIIQQLIYSKENKDLKHSNLKKIENIDLCKIDFEAFLCLILIPTIVSIIIKETTKISILELNYFFTNHWILSLIIAIAVVFSVYYVTSYFIIKLHKIKVSKLCINNIELSFDKDNSLFDKYLNEIVYFFEATKSKLVVIEDLDRFDASLKIFTKLREINTLLNNYPGIRKTGTVKFIYMIKDDVFSKYERTKFFDYIIPVIPTLSVNNSASIFRSELGILKDKIILDDEYLIDIQDHLKDFRLLKNCINEFYIYKDELKNIRNELLSYKIHAILNEQDSSYIDKLINKKLFSLILYKNLFPKDFSNLEKNEGVLFDCLNRVNENLDMIQNERPYKSIKEILSINNSPDSRARFKLIIKKLNEEHCYNNKECVDSDLLITMLFNGYIENDYEMYIKKYDGSILNHKEQAFLLNVKNDLPASKDLELRKEKLGLICKSIKNYQWNSPGVLNNTMIDYILTGKEPDSDHKAAQIVEAMLDFDKKNTSSRFIPQYFEHYALLNDKSGSFIKAIVTVFLDKSSHPDNDPDIIDAPLEYRLYDSIELLEYFFKDVNANYFTRFLSCIAYDGDEPSVSFNTSCAINNFLNYQKNQFFKERIFIENNGFSFLVDVLEANQIRISLTPRICKELKEHRKLSSRIYNIEKSNIDLILNEFSLDTNQLFYLTRCFKIDDLRKKIIDNTLETFNKILFTFTDVDEDYYTLKIFFDSSNKSGPKIDPERTVEYINRLPFKWEKFVLYNKYASFDDDLSESIKNFMNSNILNQNISESLKEEKTDIKEFVRDVIKKSNITNDVLSQYFFPFWEKYISILNCYEENKIQEIQEMDLERNHLLQKYTIIKAKDKIGEFDDMIKNSSDIIINLISKDIDYFERIYFEKNYSEETELEKMILETKMEKADSIKGVFVKNFDPPSKIEENEQRFKLYKNAGLQIKLATLSNMNFLNTLRSLINGTINNAKAIDLVKFNRFPIGIITQKFKSLSNMVVNTNDLWSILLIQNLAYWGNRFNIFIEENTTSIGNGNWVLKESDGNNEDVVNERIESYEKIVQKLEFWENELDEYVKVFKS